MMADGDISSKGEAQSLAGIVVENGMEISTKDHPGEFDAFETAKPGEPIFTIQGGDPFGPPTVQFWADLARDTARKLRSGPDATEEMPEYEPSEADKVKAEKLLRKATSAEQVSWAMIAYQRGHTETPPETRARYNEDQPLPEDGNDRSAQRKLLIAGVGQLNNALSIANDLAEQLDGLNLHPDAVRDIKDAVGIMKAAAEKIEPRRGMERS